MIFSKKKETINFDELLTRYITYNLNFQIDRIDGKIRKKVKIYVEDNKLLFNKTPLKRISATCLIGNKPPIITIYIPSFVENIKEIINDNIIEMLKHEITHSTGISNEGKTTKMEKEIEIFKDNKKNDTR